MGKTVLILDWKSRLSEVCYTCTPFVIILVGSVLCDVLQLFIIVITEASLVAVCMT
jgi:hypothetical protein